MTLTPLAKADFQNFKVQSFTSYAANLALVSGLSVEHSQNKAEEQFTKLLPDGIDTKNNFFYTIQNENRARIGHLWFALREDQGVKRVFICDIFLDENFRGRGYGTKVLKWLEVETLRHGASEIQLHVFGHNKNAQRLYESLGFAATNINMSKKLS